MRNIKILFNFSGMRKEKAPLKVFILMTKVSFSFLKCKAGPVETERRRWAPSISQSKMRELSSWRKNPRKKGRKDDERDERYGKEGIISIPCGCKEQFISICSPSLSIFFLLTSTPFF